jgi:hypothetical protein
LTYHTDGSGSGSGSAIALTDKMGKRIAKMGKACKAVLGAERYLTAKSTGTLRWACRGIAQLQIGQSRASQRTRGWRPLQRDLQLAEKGDDSKNLQDCLAEA